MSYLGDRVPLDVTDWKADCRTGRLSTGLGSLGLTFEPSARVSLRVRRERAFTLEVRDAFPAQSVVAAARGKMRGGDPTYSWIVFCGKMDHAIPVEPGSTFVVDLYRARSERGVSVPTTGTIVAKFYR